MRPAATHAMQVSRAGSATKCKNIQPGHTPAGLRMYIWRVSVLRCIDGTKINAFGIATA
jgi:hypothetical protein